MAGGRAFSFSSFFGTSDPAETVQTSEEKIDSVAEYDLIGSNPAARDALVRDAALVGSLKTRLAEANVQLQKLEREKEEKIEQLHLLNREVVRLSDINETTVKGLNEIAADGELLKTQIAELEKQKADHEAVIAKQKQMIGNQYLVLTEKDTILAETSQLALEKEKQIQFLQAQLAEARKATNSAVAENRKLSAEKAQIRTQLAEAKKASEQVLKESGKLSKEVKELSERNKKLEELVKGKPLYDLKALQNKNAALSDQLKSALAKMGELQAETSSLKGQMFQDRERLNARFEQFRLTLFGNSSPAVAVQTDLVQNTKAAPRLGRTSK